MTKQIGTLTRDIFSLLEKGLDENQADKVAAFAQALASLLTDRLIKKDKPGLSMSRVGLPDRKLWYTVNTPEKAEPFTGQTLLKFLYGDLVEQLVLFLADAAGHKVELRQHKIAYEGVPGSIDAVIDGVLVDAKSASSFGYRKFVDGSFVSSDPFGYVPQLTGYLSGVQDVPEVVVKREAVFLVVDKEGGKLTLAPVTLKDPDAFKKTVHRKKQVLAQANEPDRCYDDVPAGASGNRKLGVECSYCSFKQTCWRDANHGTGLQTYIYASGPVFLTHVEKEPKVDKF